MGTRQKILSVVGTRPNFMKMAPIIGALERRGEEFEHVLVHTGQHYDEGMSEIFLRELGVREPDHRLDVGSGTHARQTASVMKRLEPILLAERPDVVLAPGDVNSTLAASLVAVKLGLHVAHVEAGLRSFDRTMPEEINRVITDAVSETLFTHSPEAREHLLAEGRDGRLIHYVGNTMIDTLVAMRGRIDALDACRRHGLTAGDYVVATLHRPALVDGPLLRIAASALRALASRMPVVFPVHPRTRARLRQEDPTLADAPGLAMLEPVGYVEFLALIASAAGVLTDSGGIQEETTFLGVPCLTLRENTERPITQSMGTNMLLGLAPERIRDVPELLVEVRMRSHQIPPLWDGHAAERIVDILAEPETRRRKRPELARSALCRSGSARRPGGGDRQPRLGCPRAAHPAGLGDRRGRAVQRPINDDITVVITCFNYGAFLAESVESALAQDGGEPRVIVVDDGSTDARTLAELDRLPAHVGLVRQANAGVATARNTGLRRVQTPYALALDADDRLALDALQRLRDPLLAEPTLGFSYGIMRFFGAWEGVLKMPPYDPYRLLYRHNIGSAALIRMELFEDVGGYDPAFAGYEDWEFWLHALERGWRGRRVEAVTLLYRRHRSTRHLGARPHYRATFRQLRRRHSTLYGRVARRRLRAESELGGAGRLVYRWWWGFRPLPARLELALQSIRWRPGEQR